VGGRHCIALSVRQANLACLVACLCVGRACALTAEKASAFSCTCAAIVAISFSVSCSSRSLDPRTEGEAATGLPGSPAATCACAAAGVPLSLTADIRAGPSSSWSPPPPISCLSQARVRPADCRTSGCKGRQGMLGTVLQSPCRKMRGTTWHNEADMPWQPYIQAAD
jgi:hypothetical protein